MKKLIIISLAVLLTVSLFAGCSGDQVEVVGDTQTGLGTVISISSSSSATEDEDGEPVDGRAQADVTVAAVTIDEEGTIVSVSIDTAQVRIAFDDEGQLVTDPSASFMTKKELGDDYNMRRASDIGREWDEQIESLENWMIGKTIDEVKALERDEGGYPEDSDLVTSVTMRVNVYIAAVEKAVENAK